MQYFSNIKNSLLLCTSAMMFIIGLAMMICGLAIAWEFNWIQMSGGFLALAGGTAFTVGLCRIKDDAQIEGLPTPNSVSGSPAQFSARPHIAISLNTQNSNESTLSIEKSPRSNNNVRFF